MDVAVVGGGIAGLSAAWEMSGSGARVTVYEPGRPGGKLLTTEFLGRPVDEGPDALLARVPEGVALCRELGIDGELVAPAAGRAMLWAGGRLRALPEGLVLGAPARILPLARSGIVSPFGMARALGDLVLPRRPVSADASVFDLVAGRFGSEVAEKLIEPLVGSIYAGTTRGLSAATTAPQLLRAANDRRSLMLSLRRAARRPPARPSGGPSVPTFLAPRRGLGSIAAALVERLTVDRAVRIVPAAVTGLQALPPSDGGGPRLVTISTAAGEHRYDGAVITAPAPVSARLLATLLPGSHHLARLADVPFSSVAIVTLGFRKGDLDVPEGLSGVLVAPGTGMLMTACSFGSNKWPHWSEPEISVVRVSVGKLDDDRWTTLDDDELVARSCAELATVLSGGRSGPVPRPVPGGSRVSRWPSALPQYAVGHLDVMAALRSELAAVAPTVAVAGASFGRVGVPANIADGRRAGAAVLGSVNDPSRPR